MNKKAVIIGAGIAGIAASIRIALKGYKVSVYDKNSTPGGKLTDFKLGEYRFDFGPSLFTMPQYVDELFILAAKDPRDYFEYIEIEEACRYFYPDGTRFNAFTNEERFIKEAVEVFDVEEKDLRTFMANNKKIFENAGEIFLENSLHKLKTWLSIDVLKSLTHAYVLDMLKSMHTVTSSKISDNRLIQFFDRYATYNGSNPYKASSILNSISSLEHDYGTYFPLGGMSNITKAIVKLAKELGVEFHNNSRVEQIQCTRKNIEGILVEGKFIEADIVISNMDVDFTYEQLLRNTLKKPIAKREKSSSAIIFYWGINKQFDQLGLHNIFFSKNYKKEFEQIFEKQSIPEDPTIYINISSKYSNKDAPSNSENWFVMVNVPADFGQNWDLEIKKLRNCIIERLSNELHVDLARCIEEEFVADPRTIRDKTLSHKGALYGTSSNHWLSAFMRHPNFSRKVEGLYFVGGTVHPGGGIPLCLLSSKIMSELL